METNSECDYCSLFARHVHGLTEHGPEVRGCCPFHDDHTPSWTGNRHTGQWKCFGCGAHGNAYQFAERVGERLEMGNGQPQRGIVATYDYTDENGDLLFQVVRSDPKGFAQRRPTGNGEWAWNLNGTRRVLYRLQKIVNAQTAYLVEGEKDANRLWSLGISATTNPQGAGKWREEYSQTLAGKRVVIFPDNDPPGEQHALHVARLLWHVAEAVKIVRLPGLPPKGDVSDWLDAGHTREELAEIVKATPILRLEDLAKIVRAPGHDETTAWAREREHSSQEEEDTASDKQPTLRVVSAEEFLTLDLKPREMVLGPILPTQSLSMVHSWRGVGKTLFTIGAAYAVACGGQFLKWTAPKARRVLYIDGELPGIVFQERLASAVAGQEGEPPSGYFQVLNPDLQECGMPNLAEKPGQRLVEAHLTDTELLVLDNVSTLCRSGEENASESWLSMQDWLLSLRRKGISVLMDHHSGKGGAQRGTSRREDILDTVLCLKHPVDYALADGCRFEVYFEKCRSLYGTDAQPFEAKMETTDGRAVWTMRDIETVTKEQISALLVDGLTQRQIADELKISVGKVNKIARQVRENRPARSYA